MVVRALCVGTKDQAKSCFMKASADFSRLPYYDGGAKNSKANIGEVISETPFQSSQSFDTGVHIHWLLPRALRHGYSIANAPSVDLPGGRKSTDSSYFPTVPNRWLVCRGINNDDGSISHLRVKIVESDYLSDTPPDKTINPMGAITMPQLYDPNNSQSGPAHRYLGRTVDWADWIETGQNSPRYKNLTSLGYGNQHFSMMYSNCHSVFGYYDDLSDLIDMGTANLFYSVIGWYGDSSEDILANTQVDRILKFSGRSIDKDEQKNLQALLDLFAWNLDPTVAPTGNSQSLCSGLVMDVKWDNQNEYFESKMIDDLDLSLAHTQVGAVSAHLSHGLEESASFAGLETFLDALQLGLMDELTKPQGVKRLQQQLHQRGFGYSAHNTLWTIKKKGSTDQRVEEVSLPDDLAQSLNQLNCDQQQLDLLNDRLDSLRQQIFADWYKYMITLYGLGTSNPTNEYPDIATVTNYLEKYVGGPGQTHLSYFHSQSDYVDGLSTKVGEQSRALVSAIDTKNLPYKLVEAPMPRYWQPTDPVCLIAGDEIKPSEDNESTLFDAKNIQCRVMSELLAEIELNGKVFTANKSPQFPLQKTPSAIASILQKVVNEAVMFQSAYFASSSRKQFAASLDKIKIPAVLPDVTYFTYWLTPWVPISMEWQLEYSDTVKRDHDGNYQGNSVSSQYSFDEDNLDWTYKGDKINPAEAIPVSGHNAFAHGTSSLQGQLENYLRFNDDPQTHNVAESLKNMPILVQTLYGFNDDLLMRAPTLALNINDPIASSQAIAQLSNENVREIVNKGPLLAPMPDNPFRPIRAGFGALTKLRIIDTFGRYANVTTSNVNIPAAIQADPSIAPANFMAFKPRMSQHSRLLFRWVDAKHDMIETNTHPASSPVCGWILPNYLDQVLDVYEQSGSAIGKITAALDNTTLTFIAAPGNPNQSASIDELFNTKNRHLKQFVEGFIKHPLSYLNDFLAVTQSALDRILPHATQSKQSMAVLVGRPLAVTRAMLHLQLKGDPAVNQSWNAFKSDIKQGDVGERTIDQYCDVKFPVRIGDHHLEEDGLVGYFHESGDTTFNTFYTTLRTSPNNGIVPINNELQLSFKPDDDVATVMMLIDPAASVHAATGILPTKSISIPADQYQAALDGLEVTFTCSPLLLTDNDYKLPIPTEAGADWQFLEQSNDKWVTSSLTQSTELASIVDKNLSLRGGWLQLKQSYEE